ncbi:hypothetical protein MSAN_01592600 [Mycena sanguinolenta]|uniref:Uncharacterized protein n=1 Tax=Mycena sanguinolenta TaxID=230812 RepID=A0A8H6Y3N9_9AGAR|nr:hypothetical protein MSAN_01592600 [Mycena sanguinolenta]
MDETAKLAWEIFRKLAWDFNPTPEEQNANRIKHVKLFLVHGIPNDIGVFSLSPPTRAALQPLLPVDWVSLKIGVEDVFNSFFLHALLLDHLERQDILQLRHDAPSHAERLRPALEARNSRMAGTGQEEWNHYCDLCCCIFQEDAAWYFLHSAITDGDTMGHFSCAVLDCQEALRAVWSAALPRRHLASECAMILTIAIWNYTTTSVEKRCSS